MDTQQPLERDERTVAVEDASYRWGYLVLSFALLADVVGRALVLHQAAWELLAFVVIGGGVCRLYQGRRRVLAHGWWMKALLVACLAGVIAALIAMSVGRWIH